MQPSRPRRIFRAGALLSGAALAALALAAEARAADPVTLKFLFWTFQPQTVQGFADEFMRRNPGIRVELDGAPSSEYNAKAALSLRSGAPVDVLYVRDATLSQWVENRWLHPIDDCPGVDAAKKDMLALARQSQSYKGKLYGLTYYTGYLPIIVNTKMMRDAGFAEPPRTLQGWLEQARAVKQKGIVEYPMVWPLKPYGWGAMYVWAAITAAKGGKVFDDRLEVTPVGLEALRWWRRTFDEGLSNPANIEWNNGDAANVFMDAKAYMQWSLHIYAGNQFANHPEKSKVRGQAMLVDPPETGTAVGFAASYGIAAASKHKDAACRLVTFLGGRDAKGLYTTPRAWVEAAALAWGQRGVEKDPAVRTSLQSWGADPDRLAASLDKAVHLGEVVPYQELWYFEWQEYADKQLQEILAGRLSPEDGARNMTQNARRLAARYKR
jgi:multiple sugar transport system substrate-binding protein